MDFFIDKKQGEDFYSLVIEKGDIKIADRKDEIKQRIVFNLMTFRNENKFYSEAGTDYVNNIFPYEIEDVILQDEFKNSVLKTRGVLSLSSFSIQQESEKMRVDFLVETEEGEIKISELV
jgi:hypothetical protein